jgi:hypothetical protein
VLVGRVRCPGDLHAGLGQVGFTALSSRMDAGRVRDSDRATATARACRLVYIVPADGCRPLIPKNFNDAKFSLIFLPAIRHRLSVTMDSNNVSLFTVVFIALAAAVIRPLHNNAIQCPLNAAGT